MRKWHAEWTVSRAIIVAGRCDTLNEQLLTWSSRYKNFKCLVHNKFFEVNIYQKDPVNAHHWRLNIARPGSEIDL